MFLKPTPNKHIDVNSLRTAEMGLSTNTSSLAATGSMMPALEATNSHGNTAPMRIPDQQQTEKMEPSVAKFFQTIENTLDDSLEPTKSKFNPLINSLHQGHYSPKNQADITTARSVALKAAHVEVNDQKREASKQTCHRVESFKNKLALNCQPTKEPK